MGYGTAALCITMMVETWRIDLGKWFAGRDSRSEVLVFLSAAWASHGSRRRVEQICRGRLSIHQLSLALYGPVDHVRRAFRASVDRGDRWQERVLKSKSWHESGGPRKRLF